MNTIPETALQTDIMHITLSRTFVREISPKFGTQMARMTASIN